MVVSALSLCLGCGQTIGQGDEGIDTTDGFSPDHGADTSVPDVAQDTVVPPVDAAVVDVFDAATVDARPDVPAFDVVFSDVVFPDVVFPDVVIPMPDASSGCNSTLNDGPLVTFAAGVGSPPVSSGGPITPGHYQLTSIVLYGPTPPPPLSVRSAVDLTATTINPVASVTGMAEQRSTLTYTVSGSSLTQTQTCPTVTSATSNQFTADATHFIITATSSGSTTVGTYVLH